MILSELMQRLDTMYPNFGLEGWKPEYKRALGSIPGDALEKAFNRAMDGWKKTTPPKPADILENVPAMRMSGGGRKLRRALTEDEARAWVESHSYLRDTFTKNWQNVLVAEDFTGSARAEIWQPPTDEDKAGITRLISESLREPEPMVEEDEPLPPRADDVAKPAGG